MTVAYGWGLAFSFAGWAAVGWVVRVLIDPRRSLVAPVRLAIAWLDSRTAIRIVQVMAAIALIVSVGIAVQQYRLTGCVARYNERSNESQRARAEAADSDRKALDDMLQVVADDPRQAIVAIRHYNDVRARADAQRANNPIPAPPSETCG